MRPLHIAIIILAGGKGTRIGGQDKGWCLYQGQPFIEQVLSQLQQQSRSIIQHSLKHNFTFIISANRNLQDYQKFGVTVVSDKRENYCGPLSGIESAMLSNKDNKIDRWIVYPVDSVIVPLDYISKMLSLTESDTGYLRQEKRNHYAHLSIGCLQQKTISIYLDNEQRSVKGWLKQINAVPIHLDNRIEIVNLNHSFDPKQ